MGPREIFDNDDDTEFLEQEVSALYNDGVKKDIVIGSFDGDEFEYADASLDDIDFSEFKGDFKSSLKQIHGKLKHKKPNIKKVPVKRKAKRPLSQTMGIKSGKRVLHGNNTDRTAQRVLVPPERQVIVQGVDNFMLADGPDANSYKNIGYYKGKKLQELNLTFNNDSAIDFNFELFNPSMPMDYLFSTGGNLNNKIQLAGGVAASYSDVLWYMLANPTLIPSVRMVLSGPSVGAQTNIGLTFKNKNIAGEQIVNPLNVPQQIDTQQFQSQVIAFDLMVNLNRPFIPDGMDVINYTVLAGNTVTICFYYKQKQLKKFFWKEAKDAMDKGGHLENQYF